MTTLDGMAPLNGPTRLTVNGQRVPQPQHLSHIAILGLAFIGFLFLVFLWCYISPLFRKTKSMTTAAQRSQGNIDAEGGPNSGMNESEKNSLIAWMRRRSRGRFADTDGSNRAFGPPSTPKRGPYETRLSFFSRISIIPHIAPSSPPPAYATRPPTPTRGRHSPPTVSSPLAPRTRSGQSRPGLSVPRIFIPARRISFRSNSTPVTPIQETSSASCSQAQPESPNYTTPTKTSFRPTLASRSVSDSTLHPSWMARLPLPSRALVVDRENSDSNVCTLKTVPIPIPEVIPGEETLVSVNRLGPRKLIVGGVTVPF